MPVRDAERALAAKVGTGVRFHCRREEKDETLAFMKDVDYVCDPVSPGPDDTPYWIGTSKNRITDIQAMP
jgi:hypothetical protein